MFISLGKEDTAIDAGNYAQIMLMPITTWAMLSKTRQIRKAMMLNDYAEAYNNMGALKDQGKLEEAIEVGSTFPIA